MTKKADTTTKVQPFDGYDSQTNLVYYTTNKTQDKDSTKEDKEKNKNKTTEGGRRTKQVVSEWASNVSCHGIPNIERSRNTLQRVIWTLLFLSGAVVMVYLIMEQINLYYSYPVIISVNVTHTREMTFPAVTVCNLNSARKSYIGLASPHLDGVLNHVKSAQHGHHAGRHEQLELFRDSWAKLAEDIRKQIGHQREDFIIDCSFNGATCYPKNFTLIVNPIYGNCFTFNAGLHEADLLKTTLTGPQFGLTLELDIEQWEYISDLTETAGARLLVHPPDRMPFPEDEGYYLEPGQLNSIGIRTENITRLKSPFPSHCIDPPHDVAKEYNIFAENHHVKYTVQACMKTCLQKHMISECNCSDPKIPNNGTAVRGSLHHGVVMHPCTTVEEIKCEHDVREDYRLGHMTCDCPTACLDVSYMGTMSQGIWPNKAYTDELAHNLKGRSESLEKLLNDSHTYEALHANLLKVEVFFEELNYMLIEEVRSYTWFSLLSDVGGLGGLWLGVSMVAVFEFFELLLDLAHRWGIKVCNMGKTVPKD